MKELHLRAMEPHDIETIYRWENDPEVWKYSAAHQPFSQQLLRQFIDEQQGADIYLSRQLRLMADNADGTTVGCLDLFDFDPYHHRAGIGLLVDSRQRRQGYGRALLQEAETFAHTHLQLHQLHGIVAADNPDCLSIFRHQGYTNTGILRDWLYADGSWHDALSFQKIIE